MCSYSFTSCVSTTITVTSDTHVLQIPLWTVRREIPTGQHEGGLERPCCAVTAWRSLHINIYSRQRHQMISCAVQPVWWTNTHPSSWALACLSWLWPWPCHPLLQKADGSDGPWFPSQRWCTGSWHLEYRREDQHKKGATVGEGEVNFKRGEKLLNTDVHTFTNYSALCHLISPGSLPT